MIIDVIAGFLLLSGSGLCLLAGIGLHRFDDVFARMHIATKPPTLGLILLALGVGTHVAGDDLGADAKIILIVLLALITAPTAAQMMGRAAYRSGNELAESTVLDELASFVGTSESGDDTVDGQPTASKADTKRQESGETGPD